MKSASLKLFLVVTGAILFNLVFWQEKLALNALLFDLFILTAIFYTEPGALKKSTVKWLLVAHTISCVTLVIHNTLLSQIAFSVSMLLTVMFVFFEHRSAWYAAGSALLNYIAVLPSLIFCMRAVNGKRIGFKGFGKVIRFMLIPLMLGIVFFALYNFSNAVFQQMMNDSGFAIQRFFLHFFDWLSWDRFGFLFLGLFITGGILLKSGFDFFSRAEKNKTDLLIRQRRSLAEWKQTGWFDLLTLIMGKFANGVMALRNENTTGIISLSLLNLLLLVVNCTDIIYVWFGFTYNSSIRLSAYVHEGAGMLIFSIVAAMLLLLFFFRGNLNFYRKNKWLKIGAYAWILQNMVLVVSVFVRDYYYISHYGLAYKRIGVLVFLAMVLAGLITVFIKIQWKMSAYYLFRINAWFAMVLLVISSCIHWDELIARYNLSRKSTIPLDVKFLLTLSDKTLPLLDQNRDLLEHPTFLLNDSESESSYQTVLLPLEFLDKRKMAFLATQKDYSWLSWNLADYQTKKLLQSSVKTASLTNQNK